MKKYLLNLIPLLMAALMASCGKQEEGTTSNYTIEEVSADDHVTVYKTNLGHVIRDTMGVAPQNEKVDITDSMGRPLAVAGRASECSEYTLVKYLYDKQGNIAGFVRSKNFSSITDLDPKMVVAELRAEEEKRWKK